MVVVWRISLFIYSKYDHAPYFTYFRSTTWVSHHPDRYNVRSWESALDKYARISEQDPSAEFSKVKREIEQVEPESVPTGWLDDDRQHYSEADGDIPAESYTGHGQTRFADDYDDAGEA